MDSRSGARARARGSEDERCGMCNSEVNLLMKTSPIGEPFEDSSGNGRSGRSGLDRIVEF